MVLHVFLSFMGLGYTYINIFEHTKTALRHYLTAVLVCMNTIMNTQT